MIGPLPTAPGGFNRVLVAIDKFTKWIEVKPVTCPKADRVLDFLDELVHLYRLPHRIITDLGSNFNNHQFREYCENSGIDVQYVSIAHPRANRQVERANRMVLDALKKRLHDATNSKGGKWIKELPNALWGLRTQSSKPTGQSPYFLVYGSEAILTADVIWNSPAVEHYDEGVSEDNKRTSPKTQNTSRAFPHLNKRSHGTIETSLLKNTSRQPTGRNRSDRFGKPVSPVSAWTVGKNTTRGKNSTLPSIDLPIRSTNQSETLGIDGVPRGLPLARSLVPKTHSIKRNQKSTLKSTSNPKTPKPPKSSPLTHGFGRGITAQRTTEGSHEFPPSNLQEQGPKNTPRKSPREGTENHH
jgi:hypothetical protein